LNALHPFWYSPQEHSFLKGPPMDALAVDDVVRRIWAEYAEMPGLSLTVYQGQRLWGVDRSSCISALELLTTAGFLRKTTDGRYVRATEGRTAAPSLRMARAESGAVTPVTLPRPRKAG
jgi:hypothetical protein